MVNRVYDLPPEQRTTQDNNSYARQYEPQE